MITFLIITVTITFGVWIVYNISKRVEIDRQMEWKEFLVLHPELVKKIEPITASVNKDNMSSEEAKLQYVDAMWHRSRVKGDKSVENKNK